MSETASAIDSFEDTLRAVMKHHKPKNVIEFGPGRSTEIILEYDCVEYLCSVEHDSKYVKKIKDHPKLDLIYEPSMAEYRWVKGKGRPYDLIFIDGRDREKCLDTVKLTLMHERSIVVLHDAKREQYQDAINRYKYKQIEDDGHTMILADWKFNAICQESLST